jgi:hypothetical protein
MARHLIVTIDTEVDKGPGWRIADPPRFRSVTEGIPKILSPLFKQFNVKPTYFVSPEVLEDADSAQLLRESVRNREMEVGAHLHPEFVEPGRRLFLSNMGGGSADQIQKQLSAELEESKLANLTRLHEQALAEKPLTFRAGRFGLSENTLPILAKLGYRIDSSVTPAVRWQLKEGVLDYRAAGTAPHWVNTPHGRILEVPLAIAAMTSVGRTLLRWPHLPARVVGKVLGRKAKPVWLRPGYSSTAEMIDYVRTSTDPVMVLMFHSVEVIPGANPYFLTQRQTGEMLDSLGKFFEYCSAHSIQYSFLRDIESAVP